MKNTIKAKKTPEWTEWLLSVEASNRPGLTECMAQAVANLASVNLYLEPGEALKV